MKKILAALTMTLALLTTPVVARGIEDGPGTIKIQVQCKTPLDTLREGYQTGFEIRDGFIDQELVRAKEYVSTVTNMPVENMKFDRYEVYTGHGMVIGVGYLNGCVVNMERISEDVYRLLVKAARGDEI